MKWIKIALTSAYMIIAVPALGNDYIEGVNELGTKFKLSKTGWPIAFNCYERSDGKGFNIRKDKRESEGLKNAVLFFPEHMGYFGDLYPTGLGWRFDWTDQGTRGKYALLIKRGGTAQYHRVRGTTLYYEYSLTCKSKST